MNGSNSHYVIINRIIIKGKAGTGKSTLIHHIVQKVSNMLSNDSIAIAVTANTGAAVLNLNGNTLHSLQKMLPFRQTLDY